MADDNVEQRAGRAKIKLARNGIVLGDFDGNQLIDMASKNEVLPTDHVFVPGSSSWVEIGNVPSLMSRLFPFGVIPPPPKIEPEPVQIETAAPLPAGNEPRKMGKGGKVLSAIVGILILLAGIAWIGSDDALNARVFTVGQSEEWNEKLNGSISDLSVSIDRSEGLVTIEFDYDRSRDGLYKGIPRPFMVRFFDAEGNYLTHFTTTERYVEIDAEFPYNVVRLKSKGNRLQYKIAIPSAAFAKIVEFGFSA